MKLWFGELPLLHRLAHLHGSLLDRGVMAPAVPTAAAPVHFAAALCALPWAEQDGVWLERLAASSAVKTLLCEARFAIANCIWHAFDLRKSG